MSRESDIFEIQQLAIRYAHFADTKRFAEQAGLFTPDSVWDGREVGLGLHEGPENMRKLWSGLADTRVEGAAHLVVNHLIDKVEGDTASGSVYIYSETRIRGGILRFAGNLVHDVYSRTKDGWRFKSRKITALLAPRMEPRDAEALRG